MKKKISLALASVAVALISVSFIALLLMTLLLGGGTSESRPQSAPTELRVGDRFKMFLTNTISGALDDTDIYGCQQHVPLAEIEL